MTRMESTKEESERMYQRWDLSRITFQVLKELEVDLAVLSKELTRLADMSIRITDSIHVLGSYQSEQESQD